MNSKSLVVVQTNATTWTAEEANLILLKATYIKTSRDLVHRNPPEAILKQLTREELFQTAATYDLDYNDVHDALTELSHEQGGAKFIEKANLKFETAKAAIRTADYAMSFMLKAERFVRRLSAYIAPTKKKR